MRRMARMFFAAGLLSLSALLPATALASGHQLNEYVTGAEYALATCSGGSTGSFAGHGSATSGGAPNAAFNTTICHSPLVGDSASILAGGSFTLVMSKLTLVGQYVGGTVGPGRVSGKYFCTEVFPLHAELGRASSVPEGATNIIRGTGAERSHAVGQLTHYGLLTTTRECRAYAASITGWATLNY